MQTPAEAFIIWFERISPMVRESLAHMFRVLTTDDTTVMAGERKASLVDFRGWLIKPDFPLRLAARMFYVRSIFDMVMAHHQEILQGGYLAVGSGTGNVREISPALWQKTAESWRELRQKELADTYIHSWASWMIKLQMERA